MSKEVGIGVDIGGTSIKYALGTKSGEVLKEAYRRTKSDADSDTILNDISDSISEIIFFAKSNNLKPRVVGVGTPGSVDVERGYLKGSTPNFKSWKDVEIGKELTKKINLPVYVDNDANLMALAEAKFGAGIGHENIICLTLGTGIGGGIIINGNLYRGSQFSGAELGHMTVKFDGLKCLCGGRGCLERYASATAMIDYYHKIKQQADNSYKKEQINVKNIFKKYREGDLWAAETIQKSTYYLGRGIANIINIFNPTRIIIGGGVAEAGSLFLKEAEQVAFQYAMENSKQGVKIVKAKLGNKAGYLGAIYFAFERLSNLGNS